MSNFQIPLLSDFVGFLADIMRVCLEFCYKATVDFGFPSYGIAIIVLTVIIKTLLLPFALKQIKSMRGMQELQPKIAQLQKKYKNDKVRLAEEMKKLYRENNVSPAAGCLPLLIQMPFLVSIYYALQGFPYDPAHESFLWLESLAASDPTYVLPILSAASTFVISWQTTPKDAPSNQKTMLLIMPLMIGYISLQFPSGLVIYWIVCNLYQFVQQTIMFRDELVQKFLKGNPKKGVVTVSSDGEMVKAATKKKKVIRKRVIRKVAKKKTEADEEEKEVSEAVHAEPADSEAPVASAKEEIHPISTEEGVKEADIAKEAEKES